MDISASKNSEAPVLVPLTPEQDAFALAVVEYNGNLRAAYLAVFGDQVQNPLAHARALAADPSIAARVRGLLFANEEQSLISTSAHLAELAEIRDMAKKMGAVKCALEAEKSRGEVAGFYKAKADESASELERELAKDAVALSKFVKTTMSEFAKSLPV